MTASLNNTYTYYFVICVIFSSRRNRSVKTARGNSNPSSDSYQTTKQNDAATRDGSGVLQCFVFIRGLRSDRNDERASYSPKTCKRKEKAERN